MARCKIIVTFKDTIENSIFVIIHSQGESCGCIFYTDRIVTFKVTKIFGNNDRITSQNTKMFQKGY